MTDTLSVTYDQADWKALRDIIKHRSFSQGDQVTLSSGRTSAFYFNMKPTMVDPQGSLLIANLCLQVCEAGEFEFVGGLEMGAVPIVCSIAPISAQRGHPQNVFFVRKQAKGHGTQNRIDSIFDVDALKGARILVVEDVTTSGGSALQAVDTIRELGGVVDTVLTLVDRLEGAQAAFAQTGLNLMSIFTADDFRD
jgi:orotate phosphoribosyltransferase